MKTLITGGAGFIGSHLTEALLAAGDEVTVLDDMRTGDESNLRAVLDDPKLSLVRGSILDAFLVNDLVSDVDVVYHLAATVGVFSVLDSPLEGLRTNLHGTENVIVAAHRAGARVLVASTSEIYGKNTTMGLREDADRILGSPLLSRWSYAEAKAIDETLAHQYAVEHGLRAVVVRLFNTVGPRQSGRYGMVVPRFVAQARAGEDLTVYGTGEQSRCFCHVADIVPALIALVATPEAYGDVFNLGSSEMISIEELAQRVIDITGSSSKIERVPYEVAYRPGFEDMQRRVPDCTKARSLVGFIPRRSLDDIIEAVIEDQEANVRHPSVTTG